MDQSLLTVATSTSSRAGRSPTTRRCVRARFA